MTRKRHFWFALLLVRSTSIADAAETAHSKRLFVSSSGWIPRGGGGALTSAIQETATTDDEDAYSLLAKAVRSKLTTESGEKPEIKRIVQTFKSMSSAQKAFKGLDGAAHEAYQRTHSSAEGISQDTIISVSGRASRSAARAGAVADGLGACELCELVEFPELFDLSDLENGTLVGRQVLLNQTDAIALGDNNNMNLTVLILYEPDYQSGAGVEHGGIIQDEVEPSKRCHGRLLVVLGDTASRNLGRTVLSLAQAPPVHVRLSQQGGTVTTNEAASVQPILYQAAGSLLQLLEEHLRSHNHNGSLAIHFAGRSLAGGVASIAATILDGQLPMPGSKKKKKKKSATTVKSKELDSNTNETTTSVSDHNTTANATVTTNNATATDKPLQGLGADRTSAITLGAPPCMSPNIQANFITSIVYGDDIICRASFEAMERFLARTQRGLKKSLIGRQMNWMTDTLSLAASNLKSHAHGSEGEEARLTVPGRAFLVHPRRLGDSCSMHEIGAQQLKGGREALRAAILWQLNDVLLSKSMWKHHQLESYIHGLDKVHLRGLEGEEENSSG